jgi:tetratricopeptide (TPR) repeat protein
MATPPAPRYTGRRLVITPAATEDSLVGVGEAAERFYAGSYRDVLSLTIDSRDGCLPRDLPFAVGALAFVGRLVEASALYDGLRRDGAPARSLAAGAFFLCVARCRAGRFDDARRLLRDALHTTAGSRDAWSRALLLQGSACVRYFTGRFERAAIVAASALACGQRARFAYAQVLANDLRGHALAQTGRVAAGLAALTQVRDQALRLGYPANAHAIEISLTLYRARVVSPAKAEAALREMASRESAQDSYSRRTLRLELASLLSWRGRASEASALVAEAASLCAGEARLEACLATARAHIARARGEWDAARRHLDDASRLVGAEGDAERRAEVEGLRLAVAHASGERDAAGAAAEALRAIAARGGPASARVWLAACGLEPGAGIDDERARWLSVATGGSARAALAAGLLGFVAEAAGLAPGRRLHLFDDALLVEDHGDLERLPALSERSRELLVALAAGHRSREALIVSVWALRHYAPERHDTLLKTAVSRLRASAGAGAGWIVSERGGYRLADGVGLVRHAAGATEAEGRCPIAADDEAGESARRRRIVALLAGSGRLTVSELAARLRVPVRTMSRELSALCAGSVVSREGAGRSTGYRLRTTSEVGGDR